MTMTHVALSSGHERDSRAYTTYYDAEKFFVDASFDDGHHLSQDLVQTGAFSQDGKRLGVINSYYTRGSDNA